MLSYVEVPVYWQGLDFEPDYKVIRAAMHQPGVTKVHLRHYLNLEAPVPDDLREPKHKSPVIVLRVSHAGPPYAAFGDVLSWPAKLNTLQLSSENNNGKGFTRDFPSTADRFTASGFMQAIAPLKAHLEHLCYYAEWGLDYQHQRDALVTYVDFVNLKTLHVPLDLVWRDDKHLPCPNEPKIKFFTEDGKQPGLENILPPSLHELVLNATDLGDGRDMEDIPEFIGYMGEFAALKTAVPTTMPDLRTIHIYLEPEVDQEMSEGFQFAEPMRSLQQAFQGCQVNFTWRHGYSARREVFAATMCGEFHVDDHALLEK